MIFSLIFSLFACSSKETTCRSQDDCASGTCMENGLCAEDTDSKDTTDTGEEPSVEPSSPTSEPTSTPSSEPSSEICTPNHDGTITNSEYPQLLNTNVPFSLSSFASVELEDDGSHHWDFSSISGETIAVHADSMDAQWYAPDFPDSTYTAVLSYENEIMGVFTRTENGIFLDGMVSFENSFFATNLRLDPPVRILKFPLQEGELWSDETTVSGFLNGTWSYYDEIYTNEASLKGTVHTPRGEFPILRVDMHIERTIGFLTYQNRNVAFVSECYGTVVSVSSALDETERDFSTAAQLLVITP